MRVNASLLLVSGVLLLGCDWLTADDVIVSSWRRQALQELSDIERNIRAVLNNIDNDVSNEGY